MPQLAAELNTETSLENAADWVAFLRKRIGMDEAALARATGASVRTVRRWADDFSIPQARYRPKIDDLRAVVVQLMPYLDAEQIQSWLSSRNLVLDGERPVDVLGQDGFKHVSPAVTDLIEQASKPDRPLLDRSDGRWR